MTTRKSFKRVVRERMAKTGERYAAARRALIAAEAADQAVPAAAVEPTEPTTTGYALRGGLHPETATVANVLAARGVTSPLDGRPLSEAMVLGIGGGLGAGYILWEFDAHGGRGTTLTLGFRNQWQYPGVPGWYGKTTARLGIATDIHETGGPKGAAQTLDGILERGLPAIAFVDLQHLATWGQTESVAGWYQVVVFERRADGSYLVDDRGRAPFVVDAQRMAAARGRVGSFKHRLFVPQPVPGPIDAALLRQAIRAGLDDQVEHLRGSSDSFSLPAWRKWSRLMTDTRNAKAWPNVFRDGRGLFGALLSVVEGVDGEIGATGGHLRDLYATFLDEAAPVLDLPGLVDAAAAWRQAADRWEDLADAAVPAALPRAADAVDAAEALHDAVMEGEPGRARAAAAAGSLRAIRGRHADAFPLPAAAVGDLLADLGARVGEIYQVERDALATTARAIGA
jgi:hypothetical protein